MTRKITFSKIAILLLALALGLSACTTLYAVTQPPANPAATGTPGLATTPTETPAPTMTPQPSATPTPDQIQVAAKQDLLVPILLYHHVSDEQKNNRYYVSVAAFAEQMAWLHDHNYQTLTVAQLGNLISSGGSLPRRPVVITFDDGNEDVFTNAFPIMQKYGFVATTYLIASWIDTDSMVNDNDVGILIASGWEVGSHSMSHIDLTQPDVDLAYEIGHSRTELSQRFNTPVTSFSYPFGLFNADVALTAVSSGYTNAVGLGTSSTQGPKNLFYLSRMEVRQEYSLDQFIALLPWKD